MVSNHVLFSFLSLFFDDVQFWNWPAPIGGRIQGPLGLTFLRLKTKSGHSGPSLQRCNSLSAPRFPQRKDVANTILYIFTREIVRKWYDPAHSLGNTRFRVAMAIFPLPFPSRVNNSSLFPRMVCSSGLYWNVCYCAHSICSAFLLLGICAVT